MDKQPQVWLNRFPVLDAEHVPGLEAGAAAHEFRNGLPREQAEARAHEDYLKERALDAAAHHLVGIRAAHGAGDDHAARQHGDAYAAAMQAAGHNPFSPPPGVVLDRVKDARSKLYSFKAHPADSLFAAPAAEPDPADARIAALLERLQGQRAALASKP